MTDIMIDIETLDTKPSAVVLSFAAVALDGTALSHHLDVQSQLDRGRTVSEDTLRFWFEQVRDWAAIPLAAAFNAVSVPFALNRLKTMIQPGTPIWANAPQFDLVILESLHRDFGLAVPWHHRQLRDLRTARELARVERGWEPATKPPGRAHEALYDCHWQLALLEECRERLGLGSAT